MTLSSQGKQQPGLCTPGTCWNDSDMGHCLFSVQASGSSHTPIAPMLTVIGAQLMLCGTADGLAQHQP